MSLFSRKNQNSTKNETYLLANRNCKNRERLNQEIRNKFKLEM